MYAFLSETHSPVLIVFSNPRAVALKLLVCEQLIFLYLKSFNLFTLINLDRSLKSLLPFQTNQVDELLFLTLYVVWDQRLDDDPSRFISHHHRSSPAAHCYLNLFQRPLLTHSEVMPSGHIPKPTFSLLSSYDSLDIYSFIGDFGCWFSVSSSNPFPVNIHDDASLTFCPSSFLTSIPVFFLPWSCTWLFFFSIKNFHLPNLECKLSFSLQPQTLTLPTHLCNQVLKLQQFVNSIMTYNPLIPDSFFTVDFYSRLLF